MYMKYIFLCEGGMHFLITGFASSGYLHGKARLGELSFELSLSAVCDCGMSWSYSLTFLMSLLLTVLNKSCLEKSVTKLVMSQFSCLASSSPCCWGDCGSSWSYSLTF